MAAVMPSSERPQSLNSRAATLFGGPQRLAQLLSVARILIVDDEVANVRLLGEMLKRSGFAATVGLSDSRQLEQQFETTQPDLVLLDLHMPHRDGFAVLEALSPWIVDEHLPVCVVTGDMSLEARRKALALGARDFITKPFDLTEVVLRPEQSLEYNEEQVRAATFLGLLQAQLTDFNLRFLMRTTDITRKEPLLGVSLTGLMDDPVFTDGGCEALDYLRSVAHEEVQWWCALMDWRVPLAITTVKPSGSVSKLCGSSAGIHQRYSDYYLMNVVVPREYPLATFLRDQGVPIRYVSDRGVMFSFPTKAQEDSRGTNVLQQLERWRRVNNTWADHSVSCTIYVRQEDEWDDLCLWLLKHRDEVTGLSFMGEFAGVPGLPMPLEKLTKERYEELMETFPQELDWDAFGKHYDDTSKVTYDIERACDGDKCDVKF